MAGNREIMYVIMYDQFYVFERLYSIDFDIINFFGLIIWKIINFLLRRDLITRT